MGSQDNRLQRLSIPRDRPTLSLGPLPPHQFQQGSVDPRMLTPGGTSSTHPNNMPAQFTPGTDFATSPLSAHPSSETSRSWHEHYGAFSHGEVPHSTWPKPGSTSASSSDSKPLKRYSACHTCRRRKLKCDGRRPTCTPCQRQKDSEGPSSSTANRVHACVYDDAEDARQKERIKRSINSQLRVQANAAAKARGLDVSPTDRRRIKGPSGRPRESYPSESGFATPAFPVSAGPMQSYLPAPVQPSVFSGSYGQDGLKRPGMFKSYSYSGRSSLNDGTISPGSLHEGSPEHQSDSQYSVADIHLSALGLHHRSDSQIIPAYTHSDGLLQQGWETTLPPPDLIAYLVNLLEHNGSGVGRVIDGSSINSRLGLSPTDTNFPQTGLLHAIVAVASQNVKPGAAVAEFIPAGSSYDSITHMIETYSVSSMAFADQHAARAEAILNVTVGQTWANLELTQAYILLAKHWSGTYTTAKSILAPATASCLTLASGYTMDKSQSPDRSVNYQQTRQGEHCAWMAYVLDVQGAAKGSVTPTLRELDMALRLPTVLPMRPDDPVQYAPGQQTMQSHDLFNHHPACDSTVFLIKSAILLSRVQAFADRVRRSVPAQYNALLSEADHHQAQMGVFFLCINEYMRSSTSESDRDLLDAVASTHLCGILLDGAVRSMGHGTKSASDATSPVDHLVQLANTVILQRQGQDCLTTPFSTYTFFQAGMALHNEKVQVTRSGDQASALVLQGKLDTIRMALEQAGKISRSAHELYIKLDVAGTSSSGSQLAIHSSQQVDYPSIEMLHLPVIVASNNDTSYQQWMPEPGAQSVPVTAKSEWWSPNPQILGTSPFQPRQSLSAGTNLDPTSGVPSLSSASPYTSRHGSLSDSSRGIPQPGDVLLNMEQNMPTPSMDSATPADIAFSLQEWTNQT